MSTAFPQPTAVTYGSSDSAVPLAVLLHERGSDADQIIGLAQHLSGQLVTSQRVWLGSQRRGLARRFCGGYRPQSGGTRHSRPRLA
jgi:hypothetical protein